MSVRDTAQRMRPTPADRRLGAATVFAAILFQSLLLGWPAALLSVALVFSYAVWTAGRWTADDRWLATIYGIGLVVFIAHAIEEYATGFPRRFPALVGAPPWIDSRFLIFNSVWFAIFLVALVMYRRHTLAVLIMLFFAVGGGIGNGIGHVLLAAVQGAYFPGAWTAPLCALIGALMLWWLFRDVAER